MIQTQILFCVLFCQTFSLLKENKNKWGTFHENQVSILTNDNFGDFIANNRVVFVKFFTPWCGYCKAMASDYASLAKKMNNSPDGIPLTQVDCTTSRVVCDDNDIEGYPTLRLFIRGEMIKYKGHRTSQDIQKFIKEKTTWDIKEVKNESELIPIRNHKNAVLIYLQSENSEQLNIFKNASVLIEGVQFYWALADNLPSVLVTQRPLKGINILVYRDFDPEVKIMNSDSLVSFHELRKFIEEAEKPSVVEATEELVNDIFQNTKKTIFMFYTFSSDPLLPVFKDLSQMHQDTVLFVRVDKNKPEFSGIIDVLGVRQDATSVIICEPEGSSVLKYKMQAPFSDGQLFVFFDAYLKKSLPIYYRSEVIPLNDINVVQTIVGDNFEDRVLKSPQIIFLKIYSPACLHCKEIAPVFEALAVEFKSNSRIVFAEFNGRFNETPHLNIEFFPDFRLYIPGGKNEPVLFQGERSFEGLKNFIEKHLLRKIGTDRQTTGDTETL